MKQGIRLTQQLVLYRLLAVIATLGLCMPVWAHRAPGSLTTIEWNEATGHTEIVHRLHSHDAEHGLAAVLGVAKFSVIDIEARAQVALYVENRFHIRHGDLDEVMTLVGAELAGQFLFVYQELPRQLEGKIRVRDDILRDVYPAQVNQVNIGDGDVVHTLTFGGENAWLDYEFQHQSGNK